MGMSTMMTTGITIGGMGSGAMKLIIKDTTMNDMIFELYVFRNGDEC
jgi:hypothetical protein